MEPFAGSACLFFAICPQTAILGDLNKELIDTYQQIRDNVHAVAQELSRFKYGKDEYYRIRGLDVTNLPEEVRAARFLYLNRYCFNGLYRTNRLGKFNVPFGGGKTGSLPSLEVLEKASKLLQGVDLQCTDFGNVLEQAKPGDLVYMDPPYHVTSHRVFREYDASEFSADDLVRLKEWMDRLTLQRIEFVVSYANTSEAHQLCDGYKFEIVSVRRNIAGFVGSRRITDEIIVSNRDLI